jgi:hypothetical protein
MTHTDVAPAEDARDVVMITASVGAERLDVLNTDFIRSDENGLNTSNNIMVSAAAMYVIPLPIEYVMGAFVFFAFITLTKCTMDIENSTIATTQNVADK